MESQHMTQQTFAQFIDVSPASLSNLFNGRTKPTLNIIEGIKQKIPALSIEWLMFGRGPMYTDQNAQTDAATAEGTPGQPVDQVLNFDAPPSSFNAPATRNQPGVVNTPKSDDKIVMKFIDKPQRQITEIRIFYDDQTWETFVPKK